MSRLTSQLRDEPRLVCSCSKSFAANQRPERCHAEAERGRTAREHQVTRSEDTRCARFYRSILRTTRNRALPLIIRS
jgi:hypothetical protein